MLPIEDYAVIGDTETVALVGRNGSMDWLCLPRFDSRACFAALLGNETHGRWRIAPRAEVEAVTRRYRDDTLVLETDMHTSQGCIRLVDFMPPRNRSADIVRLVQGRSGRVEVDVELVPRFDYGSTAPWLELGDGAVTAVGGPDALVLRTPSALTVDGQAVRAARTIEAGQEIPFVLTWHPSHEEAPAPADTGRVLADTEEFWSSWISRCTYDGPYRDLVIRSLIVLKALTYGPTGGLVAAGTTSLPEALGGVRNWDYRFCWVRDATFTLYALLTAGFEAEAQAWRDWLLRAVAGAPAEMQLMYGLGGERRLWEQELGWLPGYADSRPVRIGNAAAGQFQLDVYGEVMDVLHQCRRAGITSIDRGWELQRSLMDFLESNWKEPDNGIWEVRGARRHFTHSKVMAWVAFDRAVKAVEQHHLDGPADRWRVRRDEVHREVCGRGWDAERQTFTESYGSQGLDGALLMIPLVGFLRPDDPRVEGTVAAIRRDLCREGLVMRYRPDGGSADGLPPGEGAFLLCSFWLVDNLVLAGRVAEASTLFDRLAGLVNDVGLLSEEVDPDTERFLGNFPQAFSHVALINSAVTLTRAGGPAQDRRSS